MREFPKPGRGTERPKTQYAKILLSDLTFSQANCGGMVEEFGLEFIRL